MPIQVVWIEAASELAVLAGAGVAVELLDLSLQSLEEIRAERPGPDLLLQALGTQEVARGAARIELSCRRLRYAIVALAILALGGCNAWSLPGGQALRRDDQATQDAIRAAAKDPFPSAAQIGLSQSKS